MERADVLVKYWSKARNSFRNICSSLKCNSIRGNQHVIFPIIAQILVRCHWSCYSRLTCVIGMPKQKPFIPAGKTKLPLPLVSSLYSALLKQERHIANVCQLCICTSWGRKIISQWYSLIVQGVTEGGSDPCSVQLTIPWLCVFGPASDILRGHSMPPKVWLPRLTWQKKVTRYRDSLAHVSVEKEKITMFLVVWETSWNWQVVRLYNEIHTSGKTNRRACLPDSD